MKNILLTLLVFTCSCGVHKTDLRTKEKIQAVENKVLIDSVKSIVANVEELAKSDKTTTVDKTVTVTKKIEYSEPDTLGLQHKRLEVVTEKRNDFTVKNDITEWLLKIKDEEIEQLKTINKELKAVVDKKEDSKKIVKSRSPFGLYVLFYGFGVITALGVKLWIRKRQ